MAKRDLVGQVFGHLKVLAPLDSIENSVGRKVPQWLCRCDLCGETKAYPVPLRHSNGEARRCDCEKRDNRDLTGQTFGHLYVKSKVDGPTKYKAYWLCHCSVCGNDAVIPATNLLNGKNKSCGCNRYASGNLGHTLMDLTGQRFGSLVVIGRAENNIQPSGMECVMWNCRCDCGTEKVISGNHLRKGDTLSCGCYRKNRRKVNLVGNTYGTWLVLNEIEPIKIGTKLRSRWNCQCTKCGAERVILTDRLRDKRGIQLCECELVKSLGENTIENILIELGINYTRNESVDGCRNDKTGGIPKFDFVLHDTGLLIEYDGDQHFGLAHGNLWDYNDVIRCDKFKDTWCIDNKRALLRIPYTEYKLLNKEYLQNAMALALHNANNNQMITFMNPELYRKRDSEVNNICA